MSNDINSISSKFRDYLLNRNLILSDSITNNGLSGLGVGLGTQSSLETLPNAVRASEDIEDSANIYRNNQTLKNQYISKDDMVSANIINNNFSYNQSDGGYIDNNNNLNIGGPSTQPYDIIGSIVKGEGFGLASDGFYPQFDVRSSLAGRVLGSTGLITDTPLGGIAAEQLLLALGQRATFNTQKELNKQFNLRPTSLIKGDPFLTTNFNVTVPSEGGFLGKVFDTALNLAGYEKPKSVIDSGGSIFQDEAGFQTSLIDRNNSLILNTGKGQLTKLFELLNKNYYRPDYKVDDGKTTLGVTGAKSYQTNSSTTLILDSNNSSGDEDFNGAFNGTQNLWDNDISIVSDDSKSLLSITKSLFTFSADNIRIPLNAQFKETMASNIVKSQLNNPVDGKLSKGSGVMNNENVFCRTFTVKNTYSSVDKLQKNIGLIEYKNKVRPKASISSSVLGDNGFVKITPYKSPTKNPNNVNIEKFMFSIENLAWDGESLINLPKNEIGPGDTTTGTKGRIMWFPPYDINFTDTTGVNWDDTRFIGRGEPIYTYNNTERSGTLDFKIIIDYPDYMNDSNLESDKIRASIAAGCTDYDKFFSVNESSKIKEESTVNIREISSETQPEPDSFKFYFPNNSSTLTSLSNYELFGNGIIPIVDPSGITLDDYNNIQPDKYDFGLNKTWNDGSFISDLKEKLANDSSSVDIMIKGFASIDGTATRNDELSEKRANVAKQWILDNLGDSSDPTFSKRVKIDLTFFGDTQIKTLDGDVDTIGKKIDRNATIVFKYNPSKDTQNKDFTETKKESDGNKDFNQSIKGRFHNEAEYFKELEKTDSIVYKSIKEKIKFFQPAFHSITPEGFNSRLTFLQQCTRQGPTIQDNGAQNLAFGAPPVCILRIGDFYYTKIIINNLALVYEPLVWDLNPEGVGVQPMIAKVSISFKFIGGSSLNGPINKLQNAVSFNFFGNAEVYDPRADTIELNTKKAEKTNASAKKGDDIIIGNIKEGEKTLGLSLDRTTRPIEGKTKPISNDNEAVAETELSKPVAESSLERDKEILSSFEWTVDNINSGNLRVTYGTNNFTNLSKSYQISFKVSSTDNEVLSIMNTTITNDGNNVSFQSTDFWTNTFLNINPNSSGDIPLNFTISNSDLKISNSERYYFGDTDCDSLGVSIGQLFHAITDLTSYLAYKTAIINGTC